MSGRGGLTCSMTCMWLSTEGDLMGLGLMHLQTSNHDVGTKETVSCLYHGDRRDDHNHRSSSSSPSPSSPLT